MLHSVILQIIQWIGIRENNWVIHLAPVVQKLNKQHYPSNKSIIRETNCTIHWIEIYPVDSTTQLLNSSGLDSVIHLFNNIASRRITIQWILFNPLSPNIHIQILQTDLHTFPYRISCKTLIKDHSIFSLVIVLLILITLSLDNVWILLEEIITGNNFNQST